MQATPTPLADDPLLADLLGYTLQRATLRVTADLRRALNGHQLSPAKVTALLLVRANPGCDQTALGRALDINRSSAMKLVNILAERGLVERRPGRDLRSNALHLTPAGTTTLAEIAVLLRGSDQAVTQGLSAAERALLVELLGRLGRIGQPARDLS